MPFSLLVIELKPTQISKKETGTKPESKSNKMDIGFTLRTYTTKAGNDKINANVDGLETVFDTPIFERDGWNGGATGRKATKSSIFKAIIIREIGIDAWEKFQDAFELATEIMQNSETPFELAEQLPDEYFFAGEETDE